MKIPANQRHVTAQEAVEQSRRNRREAAVLESRNGQPPAAKPAAPAASQTAWMAAK